MAVSTNVRTSNFATPEEAAVELRYSVDTVRAKLRSGEIRGVKIGSARARWRIPEDELRRLAGSE